MNLKSWLRRSPQPAVIVSGERSIRVPDGPRKWAELEETITELGLSRIEARDAKGAVLRVVTLETDGEGNTEATEAATEKRERESVASMIDAVGRVYATAYQQAANSNAGVITALTQMNGNLSAQLASSINSFMTTVNVLIQERLDAAEIAAEAAAANGDSNGLIAGLLQGATAADKPNGKPTAKQ